MTKLIDFIGRWKIRITYFASYLTPFSSLLMAAYIIQDKLTLLKINIPFSLLLVVGTISVFAGALILEKLGFYKAESKHALEQNQALFKLLTEVKNENIQKQSDSNKRKNH